MININGIAAGILSCCHFKTKYNDMHSFFRSTLV